MPSSTFENCNHTELYQICFRAGLRVRPNESREAMIAYLDGEAEPPPLDEADHPIDNCRHGLIDFVQDWWSRLATQLTCPMKDLQTNPRPCFGCLDQQVVACVVSNSDREPNRSMIEEHRLTSKKRIKESL